MMYIKLTRLDGSPIWLNSAFIVTIEPRKGGGSIVVPIGDGLDYDVREPVEQVLEMLESAPEPKVVPVPAPSMLTPTPDDVSPEAEGAASAPEPKTVEPAAKRTSRGRAKKTAADGESVTKAVHRKTRTKKVDAGASAIESAPAPTESSETVESSEPPDAKPSPAEPAVGSSSAELEADLPPAVEFSAEQVERLRKMAPKSMRKLLNTLTSHFKVSNPDSVVASLREMGVVEVEQEHIVWK